MPTASNTRPWSARRPQNLVLSALSVVLVIALVATAVRYIGEGMGGFVPYLMLVVGPILCVYYLWYWNVYAFDDAAQESGGH